MGDVFEVATEEQRRLDLSHRLVGEANVRRVGRWAFPVHELMQDGKALAQMGRRGWFRIYFGSGQKVELADGMRWTVRSIGSRGTICPAIFDSTHRKVAIAGLAHGTYGINGKDYACVLYPAEKSRLGRANSWILREFEDELAIITRSPLSVQASLPVHLGAVLLSFVLVRYGLPEESAPSVPMFRWGQR